MEKLPLIDSVKTDSSCIKLCLFNSKHCCHRTIVLCLTCLISFGSFFCYDNPAALQLMFIKDLNLSNESYMGLYAWYSWPNILMSFIGGILIDNILGIRLATIIFAVLTIIGQLLLALGVFINELWLMNLARLIFGLGAESMAVAQNTYAARWFKDKELNIVFGLQVSISRLGSVLNPNIMPILYNNLSVSYHGKEALAMSLGIASIVCIISLLFCIILGYLDLRMFQSISSYSSEKNYSKFHFSDIWNFGYGIWSLCIICLIFYSSIVPLFSLAQTLFVLKYQISVIKANLANSLIYAVSAVMSPIIGFGVDFLGRNLIWLTSGLLCILLSHILIAFTINIQPYFITILIGLGYATVCSSLWGLLTYMVPRSKHGTGFGLMQALMNLGLGIVSLIAGSLVDNYGYLVLELFFIILMMTCLCVLIFLFRWNNIAGGILNISAKRRLYSIK